MTNNKDTSPGSGSIVVIIAMVLLTVAITVIFFFITHNKSNDWGNRPTDAVVIRTITYYSPPTTTGHEVLYFMTPATVDVDYEVNLEADSPIMVRLGNGSPAVLYDPTKGFYQFPAPRFGSKSFWSPDDSVNGHIGVRLYPVHNRE